MSDRDVLDLLDRAALEAPPMSVAPEAVVAGGRRKVARRRTAGAGMALGGCALGGAVWVGLGGPGLLGAAQVAPAGTTWEAPDGVPLAVTDVAPAWPEVVLTKEGPDGYGSVTIGTGADAETVPGELVGGDLVQYRGTDLTVAVWAVPEGTDGRVVSGPAPGTGSSQGVSDAVDGAPVEISGGRLDFALVGPGAEVVEGITEVPRLGGSTLAVATGAEMVTARLGQDGYSAEVFVLPDSGIWGLVEEAQLPSWGNVHHAVAGRPWWRGGGELPVQIGRLPDDATRVRATSSSPEDPDVLRAVVAGEVEEVAGHRFGVVRLAADGQMGDEAEGEVDQEWAGPDGVWHRQDWEQAGWSVPWVPREVVPGGMAGPGEEVTLLGTAYTVAVDPHGWPQLLDPEDGSVFLRVTDELGPAAGGVIDMTRYRWPWQPHHEIWFAVDGQVGRATAGAEILETVTIEGPQGRVVLRSAST